MFQPYRVDGPEPIGFFITPKFSLSFLLSLHDPLRIANQISGKQLFTYRIISEEGGLVSAINGMTVMSNASIADVDFMSSVIVCAGYEPEHYLTKPTLSWLRRLARRGCQLGAIDTGCHLLAAAGLLDGYRVTMHWQVIDTFKEQFPEIEVTRNLYEIDRDRFTCAGGAAGFDMMLHMIEQKHGRDLAVEIGEWFIHDRIRQHSSEQRVSAPMRLSVHNETLLNAIKLMEDHIEDALEIVDIAEQVGVSKRQLERLFQTHLGDTPTRYYLKIRLKRARDLLKQTSMSVMEVQIACGFTSQAYFCRAYRANFSRSPRNDRKWTCAV